MVKESPCQTDGAVYGFSLSKDTLMCHVELPFELDLNEDELKLLKTNLHNALELVLARYWIK